MKKLMTLFAALGLLICAAPMGSAEASLDLPRPDALQVAKTAEMKGFRSVQSLGRSAKG